MRMRFVIEQRHLTDSGGKPVTADSAVSFHTCDADSVDEAVRVFATNDAAEIIGDVLKFPGFQAVATVRKTSGVYTLQISPSSSQFVAP